MGTGGENKQREPPSLPSAAAAGGAGPPPVAAAAPPGPGKLQPTAQMANGVGSGKKRKAAEVAAAKAEDSETRTPRSRR